MRDQQARRAAMIALQQLAGSLPVSDDGVRAILDAERAGPASVSGPLASTSPPPRPPTDDTEPVPVVTLADDPSPERSDDRRWSGECDPTDIGCAEALLASVDPLESVDPLSSWPDDPLVRSVFDSEPSLEPCGSGEDGGMLVCPVDDDPFSG